MLDPKCEQYWPNSKNEDVRADGGFSVSLISETKNVNGIDDVDMRVLRISNGSAVQDCVQFHMTSWPDFGVTNSPAPVVRLVSLVRAKNFSGSMVVRLSMQSVLLKDCVNFCSLFSVGALLGRRRSHWHPNCVASSHGGDRSEAIRDWISSY